MEDENVEPNVSTATTMYSLEEFDNARVGNMLFEVSEALKERGYDPISQIVGYLMSGDPGYISSHKDARNIMTSIDRSKILEVLLKEYIEKL